MKSPTLKFALATVAALTAASLGLASHAAGTSVMIDAKDVKWTAVPGFPGVHMSTVEGDAAKGAHHSFMKFDAGFSAPLHHHTSDHFVTVVAGTLILTVDGKEHKLTPGSFFAFKEKTQHTTSCAKGADCVIFADVHGAWDVVPEKK